MYTILVLIFYWIGQLIGIVIQSGLFYLIWNKIAIVWFTTLPFIPFKSIFIVVLVLTIVLDFISGFFKN